MPTEKPQQPRPLAEIQKEVFANSVAHGFWDVDLTDPDVREYKLALIHSELSEALECVRNGELAERLEGAKPCGLPSELADVVIRALGLQLGFGGKCWLVIEKVPYKGAPLMNVQICALINRMHEQVCIGTDAALDNTIWLCYCLAKSLGFDLDAAIERKHAFNLTRPHKHGKAL